MKKTVVLMSVILIVAAGAGAQPQINETDSGLKYIDHQVGDGDEAVEGKTVEVHYTGWLYVDGERGAMFDSSLDLDGGEPLSFKIGAREVLGGFDEGVRGMRVGGKRELIMPPELGYGRRGTGRVLTSRGATPTIPPNATLNFEIELLRVLP